MYVDQTQRIHVYEDQPGRLSVTLQQHIGFDYASVFLANILDAAESDREAAAKAELKRLLLIILEEL